VKYADLYVFPSGLHRVATVTIDGTSPSGEGLFPQRVNIRDRSHDEGIDQYRIDVRPTYEEQRAATNLLPTIATILRRRFPTKKLSETGDTITLSRKSIRVDELATVLVRELPPAFSPSRLDIYYYAPTYYRGVLYSTDGALLHKPVVVYGDQSFMNEDDDFSADNK
jgi:hypothetical protein